MESILDFQEHKDSFKFKKNQSKADEFLNQVIWRITDPNITAIRVPDYPTPSTPSHDILYTPRPEFSDGPFKLYFPYVGELISLIFSPNMSFAEIFGAVYTFYSQPAKFEDVQNNQVLSKNLQNGIRVLRSDVISPEIYFRGLTPHKDGYLVQLKGFN